MEEKEVSEMRGGRNTCLIYAYKYVHRDMYMYMYE